jgi:uncharacterized membrane protein
MESNPHVNPEQSSGEPHNHDTVAERRPLAAGKATERLRAVAPEKRVDAGGTGETAADRGAASPGSEPGRAAPRQTRDLNDAVHQILIIGLIISTALLVAGLIIELIRSGTLPEATLHPVEAIRQTLQLRSSGFLSLGLLVLLVTPVMRVIGSIIVFALEGDRRYALVTLTVLLVMTASVLLGHG